jgi:hypothetical protein
LALGDFPGADILAFGSAETLILLNHHRAVFFFVIG